MTTTIVHSGPAGQIQLTEAQAAEISDARTPPVTITIGDTTIRGRLSRMGGVIQIGLSKAARAELGVEYGDEVEVTIALDEAERTVEIPPLLQAALDADPALATAFAAQSYTNRKELARSITEAKKPETAERRLQVAIDRLRGTA